jgi:preprotein translocase subunit YajC
MAFAIAWFVLLAAVFFFMVVRPQRRQMAAHRALVASVDVGDEIVTAGGIHGTVRALHGETVDVEIASGVVIKLARGAIARQVAPALDTDDGEAA